MAPNAMTLNDRERRNGRIFVSLSTSAASEDNYVKVVDLKIYPIQSATKCSLKSPVLAIYHMSYGDIGRVY